MAETKSEATVESWLMDKLEGMGYKKVSLPDYDAVQKNLKTQLEKLNEAELLSQKDKAELSEAEFDKILLYLSNKTIYESAKCLRETFLLELDNGKNAYIRFFTDDTDRNIYQQAHQIVMDKEHNNDVTYKNRFDVTILVNGLPLVQIELKKSGIDINEAINQINRYRRNSFKGLFHFIQVFVVSNSAQTKYFANMNERNIHGDPQDILKSLCFYWTDDKNTRINELGQFADDFLTIRNITELLSKYYVIKDTEPTLMVMRPYQIYAVKAAYKRVIESNQSCYVWHSTGSGKTLTSFKLASLLRDNADIKRVFFLIDRKDLDDQTVDEYNSFETGCVDNTDSTKNLVADIQDSTKKLIVTTIQKMASALRADKYNKFMNAIADDRTVFIIDECHRSQFGKMHGDIKRHFKNAVYVGFTGTPIFKENKGSNKYTTADMFSPIKHGTVLSEDELDKRACVHKYMVSNAIADGNVLRFSVEYMRSVTANSVEDKNIDPKRIDDPAYCKEMKIDTDNLYHDDKRFAKVADDILQTLDQRTRLSNSDTYTAMFAIDKIPYLMKYYDYMREHNPNGYKIAAIFSWEANEDLEEKASQGDIEYSRDSLERCIKDYNEMFGTSYSTDTFDAYRKDISKRMKQKNLPQIDLLLVVNMFLTGFDSKPTNTLFLDKNLVWHSLLQAYSRTNRVDKRTKQFGQIVTYRNIKSAQDAALRLFSGDGNPDDFLLKSYEYYLSEWSNNVSALRTVCPKGEDAGFLTEETKQKMFIVAFREVAKTLETLKTFGKFDRADLDVFLDEEEYDVYKSWYLEFKDQTERKRREGKQTVLADIDFEIEYVRTDRINVEYILHLLADILKKDKDEMQKSVDLILREIERSDNEKMRYKKEIMIRFINERFFDLDADDDLIEKYAEYEKEMLTDKINGFAESYGVDNVIITNLVNKYFQDTRSLSDEDIREAFPDMGLLKITKLKKAVHEFIRNMYDTFTMEED